MNCRWFAKKGFKPPRKLYPEFQKFHYVLPKWIEVAHPINEVLYIISWKSLGSIQGNFPNQAKGNPLFLKLLQDLLP